MCYQRGTVLQSILLPKCEASKPSKESVLVVPFASAGSYSKRKQPNADFGWWAFVPSTFAAL